MIKIIFKKCKNIYKLLFCNNKFKIKGKNNKIIYDITNSFKDTKIKIIGNNNSVIFGKNCRISGLSILCSRDENEIIINNNVVINASIRQPTIINCIDGTKVLIDDDCLFSNNIEIHTSDYHNIYDDNNVLINKNIHIGKHCWIGLRVIILKGVNIADNCIVGACSIITKDIKDKSTVVVGNPQRIIKQNVHWEH